MDICNYERLHWSIYVLVSFIGLGLGFEFCEGFKDSPLTAEGFFVSIIIGGFLFVPLFPIESRSNMLISLAPFFEIVSAFWYKGQPLTLLYFYCFGFSTLQHAMHISQTVKVGHYICLAK